MFVLMRLLINRRGKSMSMLSIEEIWDIFIKSSIYPWVFSLFTIQTHIWAIQDFEEEFEKWTTGSEMWNHSVTNTKTCVQILDLDLY